MSERSRIIEGSWGCTSCDTKDIPARHKSCPSCNNPREEGGESKFDFGAREASGRLQADGVSDQAQLGAARAGADWLCEFCQTANGAASARCRHCGAEPSSRRLVTRDLDARPAVPAPPPPPPKKRRLGLGSALAIAGFLACGGAVVWAMQSTELPATQVSARWERVIHRERFVPVVKEGWEDELRPKRTVLPAGGRGETAGVENIRDCRREQRGTRKVADGTERVCTTRQRKVQCGTEEKCEVKDLGNGYAEERCRDLPKFCSEDYEDCRDRTRYREEPVYGQRCRYDTREWKRVGAARAEGNGERSPVWPEASAPDDGRLVREERYEVIYQYLRDGETETHRQEPKSEAEFAKWRNVREASIRVTNLGMVEALTPK